MHRFLHADTNEGEVCLHCYGCDLAVDFSESEHEEIVMTFVPPCPGPTPGRGHHLVWEGEDRGLDCAYGDLRIGPGTLFENLDMDCVGA